PHHYFCVENGRVLDATPLFPFVGSEHVVVSDAQIPERFIPEIKSPLGIYKKGDDMFLLYIRFQKEGAVTDVSLQYDFVIRSMKTPFWIKYHVGVDIPRYRDIVIEGSVPYLSLPLAAELMDILKTEKAIEIRAIGHEELAKPENRTIITGFAKTRVRFADAELGLIHKIAYDTRFH
ncbi:MAG: hypothetical protein AABX98_06415, partial [Nanoarchaeota archaeon]